MNELKKKKTFFVDEREQLLTANIAVIFLFLTQIGLGGIIFYRRYGLDQTNEQIADMNYLLAFSIFGFFAVRLLLGAGLPALSLKTTLLIYFGFILSLGTILTIWFGFPQPAEWSTTLLPLAVLPAVVLGLYHVFSAVGRKLLERKIKD